MTTSTLSFDEWFFSEEHLGMPKDYFLPWQERTMRRLADDPTLTEYVGLLERRVGTTTMLIHMGSYFIAQALLHEDIHGSYGLVYSTYLTAQFVVDGYPARNTVNCMLVNSIMRADWFKKRVKDRRIVLHPNCFEDRQSKILATAHGPQHIRELRGNTALFAAVDVQTWEAHAERVYAAIRASSQTCQSLYRVKQGSSPKPMLMLVGELRPASYPPAVKNSIELEYEKASQDRPSALTERVSARLGLSSLDGSGDS